MLVQCALSVVKSEAVQDLSGGFFHYKALLWPEDVCVHHKLFGGIFSTSLGLCHRGWNFCRWGLLIAVNAVYGLRFV